MKFKVKSCYTCQHHNIQGRTVLVCTHPQHVAERAEAARDFPYSSGWGIDRDRPECLEDCTPCEYWAARSKDAGLPMISLREGRAVAHHLTELEGEHSRED